MLNLVQGVFRPSSWKGCTAPLITREEVQRNVYKCEKAKRNVNKCGEAWRNVYKCPLATCSTRFDADNQLGAHSQDKRRGSRCGSYNSDFVVLARSVGFSGCSTYDRDHFSDPVLRPRAKVINPAISRCFGCVEPQGPSVRSRSRWLLERRLSLPSRSRDLIGEGFDARLCPRFRFRSSADDSAIFKTPAKPGRPLDQSHLILFGRSNKMKSSSLLCCKTPHTCSRLFCRCFRPAHEPLFRG